MRTITRLIVHCSATPDALDVGVKEIEQWHQANGWSSLRGRHCGYHYVIRRNGTIEVGRTQDEVGAHVAGANYDSLGICLVGTHEFNQSQLTSLRYLIDGLLVQYPQASVYEHRQFPSAQKQHKTCPNLDVAAILGHPLGTQLQ